jgi:hypothetical protein
MTQAESKYNIVSLLLPPGNTPFIFAMPLKPRSACSDWEIVQENLRHTIRSIRGSTVENYMIVIACHDRPDLDMESVRELQLLSAPFSPE